MAQYYRASLAQQGARSTTCCTNFQCAAAYYRRQGALPQKRPLITSSSGHITGQAQCAVVAVSPRARQAHLSCCDAMDGSEATWTMPRRGAVAVALAVALELLVSGRPSHATEPAIATEVFANATQHYQLRVPTTWERKEKAGADVLFEDPAARSTSLGVTVSPVRVRSIQDFGSLEDVGRKLLQAERNKESTLAVELLLQSSHQATGGAGALLYNYEYELDSTRGRKRILNTVTIQDAKLYIVNGNVKCNAATGCDTNALQLLRDATSSFVVTS